jgi:hypothetical protein
VLRAQGDLPAALAIYRVALASAERLAQWIPANAYWQLHLIVGPVKTCNSGNPPAARGVDDRRSQKTRGTMNWDPQRFSLFLSEPRWR